MWISSHNCFLLFAFVTVLFKVAEAASKTKPHGHQGVLEPYDGKPIPLNLTPDQLKKLDSGEAVCLYFSRDVL
jgi:hypothetical protein